MTFLHTLESFASLHLVRTSDLSTREKLVRKRLRTFRTPESQCSDTKVHGVYCLTDLSVGVQTTARASFVLSVSGTHGGEGW